MTRTVYKLITGLALAALLSACNLPSPTQNLPAENIEQSTQAAAPATLTVFVPENVPPLPTATAGQVSTPEAAAAPTSTSFPPTATNPPGPALSIDQIKMLDLNNGWGWAVNNGNMNQLLRTADGGQTWMDVSPEGDYSYYGSFFLSDQAAWLPFYDPATSSGGLLRSTDGGQSWTILPPSEIIQNAWIEFNSLTDGLAETAGLGAGNAYLNYYQTRDGGESWEPVPLTAPNPEPDLPNGTIHLCNICGDSLYYDSQRAVITYGDMASDPAGVVRLSISNDLGAHWTELRLALPDQKYAGGSVAPLQPAFFGSEGVLPVNIIKYNQDGNLDFSVLVIYTSQDSGQSWQATSGVLENNQAHIDNVQMLSPRDAFVRCGRNLCSTNDGAQTWRKLSDTLNFDQAAGGPDYVSQFQFIDPLNGWAISGESGATTLWKTSDGGGSWTKISPSLMP